MNTSPRESVRSNDHLSEELKHHLKEFAQADNRMAFVQLGMTLLGYILALVLFALGWWPIAIALTVGIQIRMFVIFHDAIHRAFFQKSAWNEKLARWLQVLTLTPLGSWRMNHLAHHQHMGDLDYKDIADTIFFTRSQYEAFPVTKRWFWRVVRSPVVFFTVVPAYQWAIEYALILGNRWIWLGWALQLSIAWWISPWYLLAFYLTTIAGFGLFHLQHAITPGYRKTKQGWSKEQAAIEGSTWLRLPAPFRWFTMGIEYHHVHHLMPSIPGYRLAQCHREAPSGSWDRVTQGRLGNSLHALTHVMWDERSNDFARF